MSSPEIHIFGEGRLDLTVGRRIVESCGGTQGRYGRMENGKDNIDANLPKYRAMANIMPVLVFRDLDHDGPCAGAWISRQPAFSNPRFCLRLAVRMIESWLLADPDSFSAHFKVPVSQIPDNTDAIPDPKRFISVLGLKSRNKGISRDLGPKPGAKVGPLYNPLMNEYASTQWRVEDAVKSNRSPSLIKAVDRIGELVACAAAQPFP